MGEFRALGHAGPRQRFELPPGAILMGCRLRFERRPAAKIQRGIHERLKARKSSQPSGLASAGYVWKDTPGNLAEHLIAAVGLRGKRVNGAEISSKGGNFIVNRGGAPHTDVLALMEMTRERVARQFGITLNTEIQMLGFPVSCARRSLGNWLPPASSNDDGPRDHVRIRSDGRLSRRAQAGLVRHIVLAVPNRASSGQRSWPSRRDPA